MRRDLFPSPGHITWSQVPSSPRSPRLDPSIPLFDLYFQQFYLICIFNNFVWFVFLATFFLLDLWRTWFPTGCFAFINLSPSEFYPQVGSSEKIPNWPFTFKLHPSLLCWSGEPYLSLSLLFNRGGDPLGCLAVTINNLQLCKVLTPGSAPVSHRTHTYNFTFALLDLLPIRLQILLQGFWSLPSFSESIFSDVPPLSQITSQMLLVFIPKTYTYIESISWIAYVRQQVGA